MTLVKVKREIVSGRKFITQIEIKNHTDFESAGYDIVCAAVSSAAELAINVLAENFGCGCEVKVAGEPPEILLNIPKSEYSGAENQKSFAICGLLDGFVAHLENIAQDYPNNVRIVLV